MSQFEYYLLKEAGFDPPHAVYPGHPATLAYVIVKAFPTYDEAFALSGTINNAVGNHRIPGAGGNVYNALDVLRHLKRGMSFLNAMAIADDQWAHCDSQRIGGMSFAKTDEDRQRFINRWREGQEQADKIKPLLLACSAGWSS